ncbi:hypothetical protein CPB85DRAFT_121096 [Mucidula mucida]|nr:hypothetical protein CPB85DRAFT_121096 [Mucidula mucida]
MESSWLCKCPICPDIYPLEELLFLLCGHGFCRACTNSTRNSPYCSLCKQPKNTVDEIRPHRIYPELLDLPAQLTERIARSITAVAKSSDPSGSAARAKELAQHLVLDDELSVKLREATDTIEQNFTPLVQALDLERELNASLQKEVERLKRSVVQGKQYCDQLMAIGKQMEKEHATHVRRLERARDQALSNNAGHAEELESRDSEIARLKAELEIKNRELKLQRIKFRALGKGPPRVKRRHSSQEEDDSLIVEG